MIGSLTFAAVMAATMAATPCEGLKTISLPNTTITTAVFVPEGVFQPVTAPRGTLLRATPAATAPRTRRQRRARNSAAGTHHRARALPRRRGSASFFRLPDQHGTLASPCRQMERKIPGRRKRRLGRMDPGPRRSTGSHAGDGHCPSRRLRRRGKRYGASGGATGNSHSAIPKK